MNTRIVSLRWIHKGQIQESIDQCITLTHTISEATSNDGEEHECEVSYANGTVTRHSAGILEVIGECENYCLKYINYAYLHYYKLY